MSSNLPKGWRRGKVEDFFTLQRGFDLTEKESVPGSVPVYSSSGISYFHNQSVVKAPGVVTGRKGKLGRVFFVEVDYWPHDTSLWVKDFKGNNPKFIKYFLDALQLERFDAASSVPTLNRNTVHVLKCSFPPQMEQKQIALFFSTWDAATVKLEKLIASKEKRFLWLASRFITGNEHPRWHIRDLTNEVSKRNIGEAIERVLSVTNNRGFVLPEDHFDRRVASSDLSNYKVVTRGQYAYNPSRINVGSIARLDDWDKGVLSPMYVVFKVNKKKITSDFFLHWLSSHEAKARIRRSAQGSVRETVSFTDLGAISFPLPSLAQQQQIASVLNTARQEIDLLKKQAEAYRKQKHGLMQKLLTGQWRVTISGEKSQ